MTPRPGPVPSSDPAGPVDETGNEFLDTETASALVLVAGALVGLLWANVWPHGYHEFWSSTLNLPVAGLRSGRTLEFWVNDVLMVVFFFVVGLEIKRELVTGDLRDRRAAAVPVLAAIGGMVVPAVLYVAINLGRPGIHGWGVPMATDIAFALGVLALVGRRLPSGVRLFLLTLAIADDVGAIVVIAIFYAGDHSLPWLVAAGVAFALTFAMRRTRVASPWWYVVPAVICWYCTFRSGLHPTLAGVGLGLLTPATPVRGRPVLEPLEHRFHPWSSFLVVPVFAVANAGVTVDGSTLRAAASSHVAWGIIVGLVVGKVVGIAGVTAIATRLGGALPSGVAMRHVVGVGLLAGIGFTVSLFVTTLAFNHEATEDVAKLAILVASVTACVAGGLWFRLSRGRAEGPSAQTSGQGTE